MMSFKKFFQNDADEEKRDIAKLLAKIPPQHAALVQGYRWRFQGGNTLSGDDQHVGYMDSQEKEICVAAPWHYARDFTVLHEIAHRVWEQFVQPNPQLVQQWKQIVANTKNRQEQPPEELFSMAYAATFAKNPPAIHLHKEWVDFIKRISAQQ